MEQDRGASGKPDRAVVNGDGLSGSALRASVPSAFRTFRRKLAYLIVLVDEGLRSRILRALSTPDPITPDAEIARAVAAEALLDEMWHACFGAPVGGGDGGTVVATTPSGALLNRVHAFLRARTTEPSEGDGGLMERLLRKATRFVSRKDFRGSEDYLVNPDGPEAVDTIAAQQARIAELEAENFTLAAGQCTVENGLIGDEHGHFGCSLQARIASLREAAQKARDVIQADRDHLFDCCTVAGDPSTLDEPARPEIEQYDATLAMLGAALSGHSADRED